MRSLFAAGALAFVAVSAGAAESSAADPRLAQGRALLAAGDYKNAETALEIAHRRAPSAATELALAQAKFGLGDFRGVLALLAETAPDGGEDGRVRESLRAEALLRLRRFDDAAAIADARVSDDPAFAFVFARSAFGRGDVVTASRLMDGVLRSGYLADESWLFRARIALSQNDTEAARKYVTRAGEAGADSRAIDFLNVEADIRDANFEAAEKILSRRRAPRAAGAQGDPRALYLDGFMAAARGAYRTAAQQLSVIEYWLRADERTAAPLALAKFHAGDPVQAEKLLRRHLDAAPGDVAGADILFRIMMEKDEREAAEAILARYAKAPDTAGLAAVRRYETLVSAGALEDAYDLVWSAARRGLDITGAARQSGAARLFGPLSAPARAEAARMEGFCRAVLAAQGEIYADTAERVKGEKDCMGGGDETLSGADAAITAVLAGEAALSRGRYREAARRFERALKLAPALGASAHLRRLADIRRGKEKVAGQSLKADAARVDTENSKSRRSAYGEKTPAGLKRAVALAIDRAALALREGDWQEAIAILEDDDAALYADARAGVLLARAYEGTDDVAALTDVARKLGAAAPMRGDATLAAFLFDRIGDGAAAADVLKRALSDAPNDLEMVSVFWDMMARHGRSREAEIYLDVLVRRARDTDDLRFSLARQALADGDSDAFSRHLGVLKAADGDHYERLVILQLHHDGEGERALDAARRMAVRNAHPGDVRRAMDMAALLRDLGKLREAAKLLDERLSTAAARTGDEAENADAWRYLTKIQLEIGDAGAAEAARRSYLLSRRSPRSANLYALALWRANRSEKALALSREAAWLGSPSREISVSLAEALKKNGYFDLARLIAGQVASAPLPPSDRQAATALIGSLPRAPLGTHELKRLRG